MHQERMGHYEHGVRLYWTAYRKLFEVDDPIIILIHLCKSSRHLCPLAIKGSSHVGVVVKAVLVQAERLVPATGRADSTVTGRADSILNESSKMLMCAQGRQA